MMPKGFQNPEQHAALARAALHAQRINGYVNQLDAPQPYDPEGTVIAVIVDVKRERPIRCALNRHQVKNLAAKLIEAL